MNPLPPAYRWLDDLQPLPKMVAEARKLFGTVEAQGSADNPVILGWAKELGLAKVYSHDEIPWCGLFAAIVAKRAGKALPSQPLWARSWVNFGKDGSAKPQLGDVLVFRRGEVSGHVGLYIGEDYGAFHVLGGNQSDGVTTRTPRFPGTTWPPRRPRCFANMEQQNTKATWTGTALSSTLRPARSF